mmetsp:Transcript_111376/g.315295  ORF Transcript_111376/g.315295 Transcript_111376/m.315295 type:complete len:540 (+) Transcript_111376:84-1703(+)
MVDQIRPAGVAERRSLGSVRVLENAPIRSSWLQHQVDRHNTSARFVRLYHDLFGSKVVPPTPNAEGGGIEEISSVIRTYRGILNEEEGDQTPIWVDSAAFDIVVSIVIIVNTIVIGLEVDMVGDENGDKGVIWTVLACVFCFVFVVEVLLKVWYHKWEWVISSPGNFVTFLVAVLAFIDAAILHPLGVQGQLHLRMISLLRIVGLVRLMKIIKLYRGLEELRLVIQGLIDSVMIILWTTILLVIFVYVSAVFLTKQIGHNDAVYSDYRKVSGGWDNEEYFGTVGRSMFTLLQTMTLDHWSSDVARHVIANQWYMAIFFVVFMVLSTFGLFNIIVSAIVERMLAAASNNEKRKLVREERTRREELESIQEIFILSDKSNTGHLNLQAFMEACQYREVQSRMKQLELPVADAAKLFTVIDGDGSRSLSIAEFIKGCTKLKGSAKSKDLLAVQAQADSLAQRMDQLADHLFESERMMVALDEVSQRIVRRFGSAVEGTRRKIAHEVGGTKPLVPRPKVGGEQHVPLSTGNVPRLPQFPNLLR